MSRRTETAYKAQSPGKSAQHDEAQDSGDRVNAAVVWRKFTSLSGEICLACGRKTAPCMATCRVIRQKSAEAIVGVDVVIDGMTIGNEPRPKYLWSLSRRSHPTEGPNAKSSSMTHEL